jgi:hypothetical protein
LDGRLIDPRAAGEPASLLPRAAEPAAS